MPFITSGMGPGFYILYKLPGVAVAVAADGGGLRAALCRIGATRQSCNVFHLIYPQGAMFYLP